MGPPAPEPESSGCRLSKKPQDDVVELCRVLFVGKVSYSRHDCHFCPQSLLQAMAGLEFHDWISIAPNEKCWDLGNICQPRNEGSDLQVEGSKHRSYVLWCPGY